MSGMIVQCKVATEAWEFEQIHRLNYQTFVEEIPQHPPNPEKKLVDKFHQENTYLICLYRLQVVGMVAVRDRRPFSLDAKLDSLTDRRGGLRQARPAEGTGTGVVFALESHARVGDRACLPCERRPRKSRFRSPRWKRRRT